MGGIQYDLNPQVPPTPVSTSTNPLIYPVSDRVAVPRIRFFPCTQLILILNAQVDPMEQDVTSFGKNIYLKAVDVVGRHCTTCTDCRSL